MKIFLTAILLSTSASAFAQSRPSNEMPGAAVPAMQLQDEVRPEPVAEPFESPEPPDTSPAAVLLPARTAVVPHPSFEGFWERLNNNDRSGFLITPSLPEIPKLIRLE